MQINFLYKAARYTRRRPSNQMNLDVFYFSVQDCERCRERSPMHKMQIRQRPIVDDELEKATVQVAYIRWKDIF